ncbi:MAG: hypothetical protein KIS96_11675 [Bauldia sp.]|nr:hypothetical protein [Bauldia sp.]MCW5777490.1 hypothetical protein [Phycisphaeraceae bacterium]
MPTTSGKIGRGVTLKMGDGASPEQFAAIANIVNIDGLEEQLGTADATLLVSTRQEIVPTLFQDGPVTLTAHFDPNHATQDDATGLRKALRDKTLKHFKIDFSAAFSTGDNLCSFSAFVTRMTNGQITVDGLMEITVELTPDGSAAPVWGTAP